MGYRYAVIGAGRQGVAAAYDMVKFGEAGKVLLMDRDGDIASRAAQRINDLLGGNTAEGIAVDIDHRRSCCDLLSEVTSLLSAAPYRYNLALTEMAITTGTNMTDLGGHTVTVRDQLALHQKAREAGISIVPDCGMGPGMNISLATYAMSLMDHPREVRIWDGGLPLEPRPPWNYALTFNINGLTNEYSGNAFFLRDGRITEVPCFSDYEVLQFPEPIGRLEAFVTSGGLSTAPWTFQGVLDVMENKTLRFPGHAARFEAYSQLGLFGEEPVLTPSGQDVVPRDVFHALLEQRIGGRMTPDTPEASGSPPVHDEKVVKDFAVMLVKCLGSRLTGPGPSRTTAVEGTGESGNGINGAGDHRNPVGQNGRTRDGAQPDGGRYDGKQSDEERVEAIIALIDRYDEVTGFTAMQRLTGWHASMVSILQAQEKVEAGALPVERAVPGRVIVEEARKRGLSIEERVRPRE